MLRRQVSIIFNGQPRTCVDCAQALGFNHNRKAPVWEVGGPSAVTFRNVSTCVTNCHNNLLLVVNSLRHGDGNAGIHQMWNSKQSIVQHNLWRTWVACLMQMVSPIQAQHPHHQFRPPIRSLSQRLSPNPSNQQAQPRMLPRSKPPQHQQSVAEHVEVQNAVALHLRMAHLGARHRTHCGDHGVAKARDIATHVEGNGAEHEHSFSIQMYRDDCNCNITLKSLDFIFFQLAYARQTCYFDIIHFCFSWRTMPCIV